MKRISFIRFMFLIVLLIPLCAVSPGFADDDSEGGFAPLSPEFLQWQEEYTQQQEMPSGIPVLRSTPSSEYTDESSEYPNGYIPIPVDFSHLANNPPAEQSDTSPVYNVKAGVSPVYDVKADALPTTFDLRNVNGKSYVSSIKNQNPYGTCWAHAALGSMESNYMMQGNDELDLSELHLAWYTFRNSDKSRAFGNYGSASFADIMNLGGNAFYPAALYSRLSGPIPESDLPYGNTPPSAPAPESYTRTLRLTDAYYLSMKGTLNINASEAQRNMVKRFVMQNGSVAVNYFNDNSLFYKTSSGSTSYYTKKTTVNHAVQIVGWDDNFSKNNFKTKPSSNGAWLIKNSWGERWYTKNGFMGDSGYFWMSYESYLTEGTSFVVEKVNNNMKVYEYDPLGICSLWGYSGNTIYVANVFKATGSETLTEVGLYTGDNNLEYEINIYKGMSSMPSDSPVYGSSVSSSSGTVTFAGYHTIALTTPIKLSEGEYFSVVVKFTGYGMAPVERAVAKFSPNAKIEEGSFFSSNGSSWVTGTSKQMNACIKAFTVPGTVTGTKPRISDGYLQDGQLNESYSSTLTASGPKPITWSVSSGTLPAGLSLNTSTGLISGTPTETISRTFTVEAKNSYGSDKKTFTITIYNIPYITTESLDCYAGYSFTDQLTLSMSSTATWKALTSMPPGLRLNAKTGAITGRPTKPGEYTVSFQVTTALGVSTKDVNFVIYEKPEKPVIATRSLEKGYIGTAYSQDLVVTGTYPIYVTIEGLPNGLSVNPTNGLISGTPVTAGNYSIKLTATNLATSLDNRPVTKTLRLVITAQPPVIAVSDDFSLPDANVGTAYSYSFSLSAGAAPITWKASGLPAGMTFSNGTLSGTPTRAGNFRLTVTASNAGGRASLRVPITVLQAPDITTPKLANGTTDKSYSARISAKGTTPITWSVSGLPDGFTYSANANGTMLTIKGTPTEINTYSLNITASNDAGSSFVSADLKVNGIPPRLIASFARGTVDTGYTGSKISATGTKPISFDYSISASDKAKFGITSLDKIGLSFSFNADEGTAEITGTPTKSVRALPITITAINAASNGTPASRIARLTISGTKPSFTEPSDTTVNLKMQQKAPVSISFSVTGTPDITFSMNKIDGFTLTQSGDYSAVLSGTTPSRDGKTSITVTAANADGKATKRIIIQTMTPPKIAATTLSAGTLNKAYNARLTASGTNTITWSVSGTLPSGIRFNRGVFSGRPTEAGTFALNVTAENGIGTDSKDLTLTIKDPNAVTSVPEEEPEHEDEHDDNDSVHYEVMTGQETENESEHAITFGPERTSESLRAGQSEMLNDEGYVIVKVLPEMKVLVSDMYDIDIELDETVETGAKLFWFAFPKDRETTGDDEISEFYDESGAEIETVPDSHKITVGVWLTEGVTYEPVIAVKSVK